MDDRAPGAIKCLIKSRIGVYCEKENRNCLKCGWNYEVERQREEKLLAEENIRKIQKEQVRSAN